MDEDFRQAALEYHRVSPAGKLEIRPTKPMASQRDLALAYSPGVAAACEAIVADPAAARDYTARGNLVAVISNGTAVLGLGNIGALAGKPVMEGKAVLFKKFAGIDVFEQEPPGDHPLFHLENVVITPHAAGVDLQSRDDMALSAAQAIVSLSKGEWPAEKVVNPEVRTRYKW